MDGSQGILVEALTAGGALALMRCAVVRGAAGGVVTVWIDDAFAGAAGQQGDQGASAEEPPHGSESFECVLPGKATLPGMTSS